jgi:nucleotide-binding universal stress UspA family protein
MHEALLPHPEHHHEIHHTDGDSGNVAVAVATPEEIRNANERYVERHVEELDTLGVEATGQVRLGDPVEEILRAALELRCDLIAMATRHRGRFARPEPGSVAEEILWQSRLPVLLVADG